MVLFDRYRPRIVVLDIILSIQVVSILIMPYFRFRSVRPELQASSGRIGEAVQATQRQQYWRYIAETANITGAAWHTALIGGNARRTYGRSGANSQRQYEVFADFFYVRCASPIGRVRIIAPIVLAQHKENKRLGEARLTVRSASPIVREIALQFCCIDRKRKYVQYAMTAN